MYLYGTYYMFILNGIQKHNFCPSVGCLLAHIQIAVYLARFRNILMRRCAFGKLNIYHAMLIFWQLLIQQIQTDFPFRKCTIFSGQELHRYDN